MSLLLTDLFADLPDPRRDLNKKHALDEPAQPGPGNLFDGRGQLGPERRPVPGVNTAQVVGHGCTTGRGLVGRSCPRPGGLRAR